MTKEQSLNESIGHNDLQCFSLLGGMFGMWIWKREERARASTA